MKVLFFDVIVSASFGVSLSFHANSFYISQITNFSYVIYFDFASFFSCISVVSVYCALVVRLLVYFLFSVSFLVLILSSSVFFIYDYIHTEFLFFSCICCY